MELHELRAIKDSCDEYIKLSEDFKSLEKQIDDLYHKRRSLINEARDKLNSRQDVAEKIGVFSNCLQFFYPKESVAVSVFKETIKLDGEEYKRLIAYKDNFVDFVKLLDTLLLEKELRDELPINDVAIKRTKI